MVQVSHSSPFGLQRWAKTPLMEPATASCPIEAWDIQRNVSNGIRSVDADSRCGNCTRTVDVLPEASQGQSWRLARSRDALLPSSIEQRKYFVECAVNQN